jgi:predicted RNase H-like HicB family nuclease
MIYAVVIEHAEGGGYSAFVPDLPGYIAAAPTLEALRQLLAEGIRLHIAELVLSGLKVPQPTTTTHCVEVSEDYARS